MSSQTVKPLNLKSGNIGGNFDLRGSREVLVNRNSEIRDLVGTRDEMTLHNTNLCKAV